ncbi:ArsR/SmtB family transcription factor [Caldimicrobium thiodismutans]|jgi:ArsR family transcriptional regulator|nr:metalloregulator ArsR/SmtB family transcription factor [Caldimicrobium thiodismutans]
MYAPILTNGYKGIKFKNMQIKRLSQKLKALSDPNRLKILYLLSIRPCCVCELTQLLGVSQPTLTKHLQKLEQAGFITSSRKKFYQIYSLAFEDEFTKELVEKILFVLKDRPEILETAKKLREIPIYCEGEICEKKR